MKMRKVTIALIALMIISSCKSNGALSPPVVSNFPLTSYTVIPIDGSVRRLAVAETWFATQTTDKIIAMDIQTQQKLWSKVFVNDVYSEFQIINDTLVTASSDQIILVNRQGEEGVITLEPNGDSINIINLASVYADYLYVIRGENWILEAYNIPENRLLWRREVGRGGADEVFFDSHNNIAYITGGSILAVDNTTGTLLWEQEGNTLDSIYESGVLYVYEQLDNDGDYRFVAIDTKNQEQLWSRNVSFSPSNSVNELEIVDNLLVASAGDLIALNKFTGDQVWTANVGESFYTSPVEYDAVLYAKTGSSRAVFAISASDGSTIGFVKLESDYSFDADSLGSVYKISDGIVFNGRNAVYIFKAK